MNKRIITLHLALLLIACLPATASVSAQSKRIYFISPDSLSKENKEIGEGLLSFSPDSSMIAFSASDDFAYAHPRG